VYFSAMPELLLFLREGARVEPVTLPLDATVLDLVKSAVRILSLRGRVEYHGKKLDELTAQLSDMGLSQQATVTFITHSDAEQLKLNQQLYEAAQKGDAGECVRLMGHAANPSWHNPQDTEQTALHRAAGEGHAKVAKVLCEWGAVVDAEEELMNATPLFWAVQNKHTDIIKILSEKRAPMDKLNGYGDAPLHRAARNGDLEVVQALLECGAGVEVRDERGKKALDIAMSEGKKEVAQLLRTYGK